TRLGQRSGKLAYSERMVKAPIGKRKALRSRESGSFRLQRLMQLGGRLTLLFLALRHNPALAGTRRDNRRNRGRGRKRRSKTSSAADVALAAIRGGGRSAGRRGGERGWWKPPRHWLLNQTKRKESRKDKRTR